MKAWRLNNMKVAAKVADLKDSYGMLAKAHPEVYGPFLEEKIKSLRTEHIPHRRSRQNTSTTAVPSDLLLMMFANIKLPVPEAWRENMIAASAETREV